MSDEAMKSALWLVAVILSLPMFIATFRKLQAVGQLIAETKVTQAAAGERTVAIRAIVAQVVPFAGIATLGLLVVLLSSTLLPALNVLVVLLAIVGLVTWLFWRSFIKVYSKAQFALQETLTQQPPRHAAAPAPMPSMLREADLVTINIAPNSSAAGKLIRELQLRTRTGASIVGIERRGASIVGIERSGASIINPGPDEELQPGDQVLLLGNRTQLDAARAALSG